MENDQLTQKGATGEVYIHGDCLALYYLNKPEQTAERFVMWHHPQLGNIRVYKTGDLACYNDDGTLQFQGRADDQVKIRGGYRVELSEIEVVIGNITGVSQVKVIVREDVPGQRRLVAYVILHDEAVTVTHIKYEVMSRLPAYMVPDSFVVMERFPYTVSGKVDKYALPLPEKTLSENASGYVMPENDTEAYLKSLWEDLLQVKNISTTDDFFDIGGTSLVAIEMVSRIEKDKGIELPIISVYEYGTVEKLAKLLLDGNSNVSSSPLVAIRATGNRPPVYLIPGDNLNVLVFSGVARSMSEEQPVFGFQPRGTDGKSDPLTTIGAIAGYYIDAILQHNPQGPYAILGYSFGGYVAFEMAKQLKQLNREVSLLGIIDADARLAENSFSWPVKIRRKIMRQFPKVLWIARSFIVDPRKVIDYQLISWNLRMKEQLESTTEYTPGGENFYVLRDKINAIHHKALSRYSLTEFDVKITLFRAKERPYFVDDFEYLSWKKYAKDGVEVIPIDGDHSTMLAEPNCQMLGEKLEAALQQSNR